MKITITTAQVVNAYNVLKKLATVETSFDAALKIAKNLQALEMPAKVFFDVRDKELKKYGKRDDKGELVVGENGSVDLADPKKFNASLEKIVATEIEVELDAIKRSELKAIKVKEATFMPAELISITFLIN